MSTFRGWQLARARRRARWAARPVDIRQGDRLLITVGLDIALDDAGTAKFYIEELFGCHVVLMPGAAGDGVRILALQRPDEMREAWVPPGGIIRAKQ